MKTKTTKSEGTSLTISVLAVLLMIFGISWPVFGIVGILIMWRWTNWPMWVKILVSLPLGLIFLALLLTSLALITFIFWGRPFQVSGMSMSPNYKHGAYLMTRVINPKSANISRGEVVIFDSTKAKDIKFIKRVIGLPGEEIMIKAGAVYINGQLFDESSYLPSGTQTKAGAFLIEGKSVLIPSGYYVTLSDYRLETNDSREWGFVPQENITNKTSFCYWNCSK